MCIFRDRNRVSSDRKVLMTRVKYCDITDVIDGSVTCHVFFFLPCAAKMSICLDGASYMQKGP